LRPAGRSGAGAAKPAIKAVSAVLVKITHALCALFAIGPTGRPERKREGSLTRPFSLVLSRRRGYCRFSGSQPTMRLRSCATSMSQ